MLPDKQHEHILLHGGYEMIDKSGFEDEPVSEETRLVRVIMVLTGILSVMFSLSPPV